MKIVEATINEKVIKNSFGGTFKTTKKLGETDFYEVWLAKDANADTQVVVLSDKNNPKLSVPLTWDELESLPSIFKKTLNTLSGVEEE